MGMRLTYQQVCSLPGVDKAAVPFEQPSKRKRKAGKHPVANQSLFTQACVSAGLPEPLPEYKFAADRKWRFDWAWPSTKGGIALEIQGGLFSGGRHVRGAALLGELEKLNAAACLGWRVLFVTPQQFDRGDAVAMVQKCFEDK